TLPRVSPSLFTMEYNGLSGAKDGAQTAGRIDSHDHIAHHCPAQGPCIRGHARGHARTRFARLADFGDGPLQFSLHVLHAKGSVRSRLSVPRAFAVTEFR